MNVRLTLAALSFGLAMVGCLFTNLTYYSMVDEINKQKPRDKQLEYFGFGTKLMFYDVLSQYRSLHPQGRLRMRLRIAITTMFVGLAATAGCMLLGFQ